MKRVFAAMTVVTALTLAGGCVGKQEVYALKIELGKVNERLNNVNRRLDVMRADNQALIWRIDEHQRVIAELEAELGRTSARAVEPAIQPADRGDAVAATPSDGTRSEDVRKDTSHQNAVGDFLHQMKTPDKKQGGRAP